jgi:hypothetical protein
VNSVEEQIVEELDEEIEAFLSNNQLRGYYLAAVGASIAAWTLMFNLGAYNVVFFRTLFAIWISCTAVFVATLLLPRSERPLQGWGLAALLAPSLWLISIMVAPDAGTNTIGWYQVVRWVLVGFTLISLPYIGYILLLITQGESFRLPIRMLVGLSVIVLVVASLGYVMGRYNFLIMDCEQFTVAGDFPPTNCIPRGE